jgi:2-oxo-4-hydroxy-4-carboxy-5-ureidoimidazoline decarboxylase
LVILTQTKQLSTSNQSVAARRSKTLGVQRHSLAGLNALSRADFLRVIGPIFEHSPWIAELTWTKRPFESAGALHRALCDTVLASDEPRKLTLIRAHPDLAGKAARAGTLTPASTREQASSGLDQLSAEEVALFNKYNREYRERFGFPFVICARQNKKEAMLAGFERRLKHSREQEIESALAEIFKIAELRLHDLLTS